VVRKRVEPRAVILGWIIANILGVAAVGALGLMPFLTSIHGMLPSTLIVGLPIGLAQWIALRRVVPVSILWVLTVSAGLSLGLVAGPVVAGIWRVSDDESILTLTTVVTTIGLLVGTVQWVLLRDRLAKSLVWLLSSAVGLGLGTGLVLISNLINQSGAVSGIVVVVVYAIATGIVVAWLPASHRKIEGNPVNAT
jgi:hypothetical protein